MTMAISEMMGMDVFTDSGKFLGTAQEFIIDVEEGKVVRILLEPLPASKEKVLETMKEKSVLYASVKSVGDVIVVTKGKSD
jgi:sporulation protein YlmC with PRC-barrel domain